MRCAEQASNGNDDDGGLRQFILSSFFFRCLAVLFTLHLLLLSSRSVFININKNIIKFPTFNNVIHYDDVKAVCKSHTHM